MPNHPQDSRRLAALTLDDASIGRGSPDQEHERAVAIYDILEANSFALPDHDGGPYALHLGLVENRLCFDTRNPPRAARPAYRAPPFAHADPQDHQGLRDDLRQLLPGDPHRLADADRGDRHG